MADLSDVLTVLEGQVAQTVYPNGTGLASINGRPIKALTGWPAPAMLNDALSGATVIVSIFAQPEERNTTRYPDDQHVTISAAPTLTTTISGQTVAIGGSVSTPQNVAVNVNGTPYVYAVQTSDTLTGIATALATLAGGANTGQVITFPNTARILSARVGASATVAAELKRQEKVFKVSIWANEPAVRDQLAGPIDAALASTRFLTMPDGFAARMIYKSTMSIDAMQKENLYRRDLNYSVEYATTQVSSAPQVVTGVENITNIGQTVTINY